MTSSVSGSDECCTENCDDACQQWLTAFCDYQTVTLSYCGTQTVFDHARKRSVPISEVNPNLAIHPADVVYRISMAETEVAVGVGATVLDSDDVEWHVYRAEWLKQFCVWKLWARSVSACFTLLDRVDVLQTDCIDCECVDEEVWSMAARTKGSLAPISGQAQVVNDSREIRPRVIASLVKWPLSEMPTPKHRIRHQGRVYRILSYTNNGPLIPFEMVVEE